MASKHIRQKPIVLYSKSCVRGTVVTVGPQGPVWDCSECNAAPDALGSLSAVDPAMEMDAEYCDYHRLLNGLLVNPRSPFVDTDFSNAAQHWLSW